MKELNDFLFINENLKKTKQKNTMFGVKTAFSNKPRCNVHAPVCFCKLTLSLYDYMFIMREFFLTN